MLHSYCILCSLILIYCLCRLVCAMKPHTVKVMGLDFQPGADFTKVILNSVYNGNWTKAYFVNQILWKHSGWRATARLM